MFFLKNIFYYFLLKMFFVIKQFLNVTSNFMLKILELTIFKKFHGYLYDIAAFFYGYTPLNLMVTNLARSMLLKAVLGTFLGAAVLTGFSFLILELAEFIFIPQLGKFYLTVFHYKIKFFDLIGSPLSHFHTYLKQSMFLNAKNMTNIDIYKNIAEKNEDSLEAKKDFYKGLAVAFAVVISIEMFIAVFVTMLDMMKEAGY